MNNKNSGEIINPIRFFKKEEMTEEGYIRPIRFEDPIKGPEDKIYLVLYYIVTDDGNLEKSFELCKGRSECVSFLEDNIEQIDINQSKVITETRQTETKTGNLKNYFLYIDSALSVYDFFKYMESINADLSIDIEDYNFSTPEEATDIRPYQQLPNTEAVQIWKAVMNESHEEKVDKPDSDDPEEDRYV